MSARKPFSGAVRALAEQAQNSVELPGNWRRHRHSYIRFATNESKTPILLYKSDDGVYGISIKRTEPEMAAELFASRAAYLAGVPVPPTFYQPEEHRILSVIPYSQIVCDFEGRFENRHYLHHYASCLPFFLWLGNDNDRRAPNMVANAQQPHEFAEFDFESTSLKSAFSIYSLAERAPPLASHDIYDTHIERHLDDATKLAPSIYAQNTLIMKDVFLRAYRRMRPKFAQIAEKTLGLLEREGVISTNTQAKMTEYFMLREMTLMLEHNQIGTRIKKPANARCERVLGTVFKFD